MRALFVAACLSTSLIGQQESQTFTTIEGERFIGHLKGLVDGTTLKITRGGETRLLALDQLSRWQRPRAVGTAAHAAQASGMLYTRSGMQLNCEFIDAADQLVRLEIPPSPGPASFFLRHLASLRLMTETDEDGGFASALDQPPTSNDLLFAVSRDTGKITRLSVVIQGFIDGNVRVLFRDQLRSVPIAQIYGLVMGRDLGTLPEALPRPTVKLSFEDGRWLSGRLSTWDGEQCSLTLAEGVTLQLQCARVRQIAVQSSRVSFLSDLEPRVEQVPAFDRLRPWLRDSAPNGEGLQLGGRAYSRGLCLIPHTKLTFDLDGTFDFFEAVIGIDDRSSKEANADFRVFADDRLVFEATDVRHGQPGRKVRVPVDGIKQLILEADFGKNFDLGDHCLFADARLLKK